MIIIPIVIVCLLLLYGTATLFQLCHGSSMMYEMRRRKPETTFLPTQGIFNLPHHAVVWKELAFDDAVNQEMECSTAKYYGSDRDLFPSPQGHLPSALTNPAISSPPSDTDGSANISNNDNIDYCDTDDSNQNDNDDDDDDDNNATCLLNLLLIR